MAKLVERFDVVIIGAGPAGLFAAMTLLDTEVLDLHLAPAGGFMVKR